jgi:hypothetical protein
MFMTLERTVVAAIRETKKSEPVGLIPSRGRSKSAERRREKAARVILHQGKPGEVVAMSDGARYFVARDGSYRHMEMAK